MVKNRFFREMRSGAGDQSAKMIKKLHDNSLKLEQFYSNMFTGLKLSYAVSLTCSLVLFHLVTNICQTMESQKLETLSYLTI